MSLLTAEQARDKARAKDPSAAVEAIIALIDKAAGDGKYEIRTRDFGFGGGSYYSTEDKWPEYGKSIIKHLTALGYRCQVRCHEGQFVDMWLEISWKEVGDHE